MIVVRTRRTRPTKLTWEAVIQLLFPFTSICFANPTINGQALLRFSSPQEDAQASLVVRDFLGRDLLRRAAHLEKGVNQFDLNLSAFQGQVVLVTLTTSAGELTERVVCW